MSLLDEVRDRLIEMKSSPALLVPPGTYQAVIASSTEDPERYCITLHLVLQNNMGLTMQDGSPVDGIDLAYNIWLPRPGDESQPSKGRGTKADQKLAMANRTFKAIGFDPAIHADLSVCNGTPVLVDVQHEEYDGELRERVVRIKAI